MRARAASCWILNIAISSLVSCSAEHEARDPSLSSSLSLNADGYVANILGPARKWSASCAIQDTRLIGGVVVTRDFLLVVGGYGAGPALGDAQLYDAASNTWALMESLPAGEERGEAKLVKLSPTSCLLIGGLSSEFGGLTRPSTYKFTTNGVTGVWTSAGDLNAGRVQFAASVCGTGSNVIVFGGHKPIGFASPVSGASDVEVWDGISSWTAKGGVTGLLNAPISAFAFAVKDSQHFVLAGGRTSAGFETLVQPFSADASCNLTPLPTARLRNASNTANALGRWGSVSLLKSSNDHLFVTGGRDAGGNIQTDIQEFSIDFGGLGATYVTHYTAAGESLLNGVRFPTTVTDTADKLVLLGGEDNSSTTPLGAAPVDYIQQILVSGTTPMVTAASPAFTLGEPRIGHFAEYLGTDSKFYTGTGTGGISFSATTERLSP